MYCNMCGAQNPDHASYCSKCGSVLRAEPAMTEATAAARIGTSQGFARPNASAATFDEEIWRAVIGPRNTNYYLSRFRDHHTSGRQSRWHWPAFFITFYWLLYRKQWLRAVVYFFLPSILTIGIGAAATFSGANNDSVGAFLVVVFLFFFFIGPPLVANSLYYSHCRAVIARHSEDAPSREHLLAQVAAHGGTSGAAVAFFGIFVGLAIIGILAAVALPAYSDYTKRAKVSEAINTGMSVARKVGNYYQETGKIPESLEQYQTAAEFSEYISKMQINKENGAIELHLSFGQSEEGGVVRLIPSLENGRVSWHCKPGASMRRLMPESCKS